MGRRYEGRVERRMRSLCGVDAGSGVVEDCGVSSWVSLVSVDIVGWEGRKRVYADQERASRSAMYSTADRAD